MDGVVSSNMISLAVGISSSAVAFMVEAMIGQLLYICIYTYPVTAPAPS